MKARLVLNSLSALSVEAITSGIAAQRPPERPKEPSQAVELTPASLAVLLEDSARFREAILGRYDEPYPDSWFHGGLND
jgi:hypothetical protein